MKDLREIKKNDEILLLRKAIAISVIGQVEVMKAIKPKMSERYKEYMSLSIENTELQIKELSIWRLVLEKMVCVLHYIENEKGVR